MEKKLVKNLSLDDENDKEEFNIENELNEEEIKRLALKASDKTISKLTSQNSINRNEGSKKRVGFLGN